MTVMITIGRGVTVDKRQNKKKRFRSSFELVINFNFTITNKNEWPPLFGHLTEDHSQKQVEQNSFTEHPTESTQE